LNNDELIIKEFELVPGLFKGFYDIVPVDPELDEVYTGELDDEIKKLCEIYNIQASIIYWCYPK
jgi:truncated hemoglobin YjbI